MATQNIIVGKLRSYLSGCDSISCAFSPPDSSYLFSQYTNKSARKQNALFFASHESALSLLYNHLSKSLIIEFMLLKIEFGMSTISTSNSVKETTIFNTQHPPYRTTMGLLFFLACHGSKIINVIFKLIIR